MKLLKSLVLTAFSTTVLFGCSTLKTTVFPGKNNYTVVATAKDGATARQGAIQKATQVCSSQGKRLVVLRRNTVYQGAGKQLGAISKVASEASFFSGGPTFSSTESAADYKTVIVFNCR